MFGLTLFFIVLAAFFFFVYGRRKARHEVEVDGGVACCPVERRSAN